MPKPIGLHEQVEKHTEPPLPSERKFGLIIGGILLAIGVFRWLALHLETTGTLMFAGFGAILIVLGLVAPSTLRLPNRLWAKFGLLLGRIFNPLIMLVIFIVVFIPTAVIMRLKGRDELNLRQGKAAASTWVSRQPPGPAPQSAINQF